MPASRRRALRAASITLGLLVTLGVIAASLQRYGLSTLEVQLAAIRGWTSGDGLYAYRVPGTQIGAALSPALALLLAPLAALPSPVAGWLLALLSVAALLLAMVVIGGPMARRHGRGRTVVVLSLTGLALLTGPVRATLGLGRPDLLLFGLVVADLVALRRSTWIHSRAAWSKRLAQRRASRWRSRARSWLRQRCLPDRAWRTSPHAPAGIHESPGASLWHRGRALRHRLGLGWATGAWAGAGIGLATAFSAAGLLFVAFLLITGRLRAARTALGTAAAVTLTAALVAPGATLTWFGTALWELDRTAPLGAADNLSLAGVLTRLYSFPAPPILVWLSFGVLLLAVGLIRARAAHADCDEITAFTLVGLTIAVAGPVTTPAEAVWLLPALLLLTDAALHRKLGARVARPARFSGLGCAVAATSGYLVLVAGPSRTLGWNAAALAVIVLLNALPWRHTSPPTVRARRRTREPAIPIPRGG